MVGGAAAVERHRGGAGMSLLYWLMGLDEPMRIGGTDAWVWRVGSTLNVVAISLLAALALAALVISLRSHLAQAGRLSALLVALRLAGFVVLFVMALQIEIEMRVTRHHPAKIVAMTDVSASMLLRDAGGAIRVDAARSILDGTLGRFQREADLVRYEFDWDARREGAASTPTAGTQPGTQPASVSDGQTRLMHSIARVAEMEPDARAIVLLTDGNDTEGNTGGLLAPLLKARGQRVYPIVFGDPHAAGHATLRVAAPGVAVRLGDEFRMSARVTAQGLGDQSIAVRVYEAGKDQPIASRENVRIGKEDAEVAFVVKPEKAGRRKYRIVAEGVKGAATDRSLVTEREVDVVDAKIKVLYIDIPRDERKILGHWLARDPVVELTTLTLMPKGGWYAQGPTQPKNVAEGLPGDEAELFKHDVIIFGDLPRSYFRSGGDASETKLSRLVDFVSRRGGGLVTLGGRNVYAAGQYQDSALAKALPFAIETTEDPQISKPFKATVTPSGLAHPILALEGDPAVNREAWEDLPTLDGSNRVGAVRAGATLLAVRQGEAGAMPVMAIQSIGKGQVFSLAVDTTWRWEMMRPVEGEDYYRRFWGNVVRVLAPDPRVQPNAPQIVRYRSKPAVGETITLATRLVDGSYRPVRGADVVVEVTSPAGRKTTYYPRDGRQRPGVYEYDIALDEPGAWNVTTTHAGKTTSESIVAGQSQEELDDPGSRPEAMAKFARATGGESFLAADAKALLDKVDLTPVAQTRPATVALWNLPITLIVFIAVVCVDCYIRKRRGMA